MEGMTSIQEEEESSGIARVLFKGTCRSGAPSPGEESLPKLSPRRKDMASKPGWFF